MPTSIFTISLEFSICNTTRLKNQHRVVLPSQPAGSSLALVMGNQRKTKRGRPRKIGPREPNGRIQRPRREQAEQAILDITLLRRGSQWLGEDRARQPEAGYAIGRLWLLGVLTRRQHDAALKFGDIWRRWASLAGVAPHILTQRSPGSRADPTAATWRKAKTAFYGAANELRKASRADETWRLVEMLVMDDVFPLQWREDRPFSPIVALRLGGALERLADWFALPKNLGLLVPQNSAINRVSDNTVVG